MSTPEINAAIDCIKLIVKHASDAYPELGLSFGYVGNLDRRWGDDRSFRVFTNRLDDTGRSVSYHLGSIDSLPSAHRSMSPFFFNFLQRALKARKV